MTLCPRCNIHPINQQNETRCIVCFSNEPKTVATRLYNQWHIHNPKSGFWEWKSNTPQWVKDVTYKILGY